MVKISLFLLSYFFLVVVGCSDEEPFVPYLGVDPIMSGDILTAAEGEWFSGDCVVGDDSSSSLEKMNFSFEKPLSWGDSFFEQKSLEFSGRLEVESLNFNNPHCLGSGSSNALLKSSVALKNISVIKESLEENSFKAFFVQNLERGGADEMDSGSGVLLKIFRKDNRIHIENLSHFIFKGKEFNLSSAEGNWNTYSFGKNNKNIQSKNYNHISAGKLRDYFSPHSTCGTYGIFDLSTDSAYRSERRNLVIIFSAHLGGDALDIDDNSQYGHSTISTSEIDWIYYDGAIHTENNFIFKEEGDAIKVFHNDYGLNWEELTTTHFSDLELRNYMKKYDRQPIAFPDC